MRAFEIQTFGLDGLRSVTRPDPGPLGPHDVLVRVKAASLNYRDLMMAKGEYNHKQPLPLIPMSDGAGEVTAIGAEVTHFKPGNRVASHVIQDWLSGDVPKIPAQTTLGGPLDGMLSELRVFPEYGLVKIADYLSDEEAATLPCAALTAWHSLFKVFHLRPDHTVLLQGTGGVSLFALQFAKAAGAQVVIISSSDDKLERAKKLGADIGINYKQNPEWGKGLQVDLVLELGGATTIIQSIKAVKPGGQINLIGRLGGGKTEIDLVSIFMRHVRLQGIFVGSKQDFTHMNSALAHQKIRPIIDRVFPFEQSVEAFKYLESAQHMGKVVIKL